MAEVPAIPYGHEEIISLAVSTLRADYAEHPNPAGLISEPLALRDLQLLHEGVAGTPLPRDTVPRAMEPQLPATGETVQRVVEKPARLFARRMAS